MRYWPPPLPQEHRDQLEAYFQERHIPGRKGYIEIGEAIGMQPKNVRIWFMNRRIKYRKHLKRLQRLQEAANQDQENIPDVKDANNTLPLHTRFHETFKLLDNHLNSMELETTSPTKNCIPSSCTFFIDEPDEFWCLINNTVHPSDVFDVDALLLGPDEKC